MRTFNSALLAATLALGAIPTFAQDTDSYGFQQRGFIFNAIMGECWFVQTYEKTNTYFTPSRPHMKNQNLRTIHFDDPECMADTLDGLDAAGIVNKTMIAQHIAQWMTGTYFTADTRHDARNRRHPGRVMQEIGECMMATDLPATAVALEFVSDGDSITDVLYAPTYGCGEVL